jgi:hypothetical protein
MNHAIQQLVDRAEIQDCLCRYARGVDRGDWDLVRSAYHPGAIDQHGDYQGDIEGFITWLEQRFTGADNSTHFLGNCLIEFVAADHAFVETYFISRRLRPPTDEERNALLPGDRICREAWGRYADHFERRSGQWRVARRLVILEASSTAIALGGERSTGKNTVWSSRDTSDPSYRSRAALLRQLADNNHK